MRLRRHLILLAALFTSHRLSAQTAPRMPDPDRIRLAEAFRLADAVGDRIWPGWSAAPFAVLLVTPNYEYLVRHPAPTPDWTLLGVDSILNEGVWYRKRQFPLNFLATFPAVGAVPTIVVGQAEHTTAKTSTPWVVTLLHEHFHQYQYSHPGYYDSVAALGLAHGDTSGMWMLNFPFPYEDKNVQKRFSAAARALRAAVMSGGRAAFGPALDTLRQNLAALRQSVTAEQWAYLQFQLWQEGTARYTEFWVAGRAADAYQPSPAFAALKDFTSYRSLQGKLGNAMLDELLNDRLGESKRSVVYNFGAAEALTLDFAQTHWRGRYFTPLFTLDARLDAPQ